VSEKSFDALPRRIVMAATGSMVALLLLVVCAMTYQAVVELETLSVSYDSSEGRQW
jgi:hypothetical protein